MEFSKLLNTNEINQVLITSNENLNLQNNESLLVNDYLSDVQKIADFLKNYDNLVIIFFNGYLAENRDLKIPSHEEIEKTQKINFLIPYFLNLKKRKKFTPRTRKFIKIWKYSGIKGVAFITPILLSPIIGAVLLNAVGAKKKEIIKWMFVSAIVWSSIECILFYLFKDSFRMISSMIE